MKSPEVFLSELNLRSRRAVVMTTRLNPVPSLSCEVRQAANRGLAVFPVPEFAKLTGKPEFFIGEATSDISRLESGRPSTLPVPGMARSACRDSALSGLME